MSNGINGSRQQQLASASDVPAGPGSKSLVISSGGWIAASENTLPFWLWISFFIWSSLAGSSISLIIGPGDYVGSVKLKLFLNVSPGWTNHCMALYVWVLWPVANSSWTFISTVTAQPNSTLAWRCTFESSPGPGPVNMRLAPPALTITSNLRNFHGCSIWFRLQLDTGGLGISSQTPC